MRRIRVTGPARRDISRILKHSDAEFGENARQRYKGLIDKALQDIGANADRVGVRTISDIREGYFLYHLKWSRKAQSTQPVSQPRHLIVFYISEADEIIVARVFHERQMPARHLVDSDVP